MYTIPSVDDAEDPQSNAGIWTYDKERKGPKLRTCDDEPIFDAFKSFAKTSRGKCVQCGACIEKGTERLGVPVVWKTELNEEGKPKRKTPTNEAILRYMHLACVAINYEHVHEEDPFMEDLDTPSPKKTKKKEKNLRKRSFAEMLENGNDSDGFADLY